MDTDPEQWTLADVQHFFRQDAVSYIADRPGSQLPHLEPFLQALADCDVDGASLLDSVDLRALRDDFSLSSLKVRGTIMHCINKLRAVSVAHRSQTLRPETPASLSFAQQLPSGLETPTDALQSVEIGENVRSGEYQVQDVHGRKRRKLDLTKSTPGEAHTEDQAIPATPLEPETGLARTGFAPDTTLIVDELFFGSTALGGEIHDLPPHGNILVDDGSDSADDNFQFIAQGKLPAEAEFVHLRIRHFLSNAETIELRRRDRVATGILPYPERLQSKVRSAIVVHVDNDDEEFIATREQASLLQSGYDLSGLEQAPDGEWDFLLQTHGHNNNDEELPVYGASADGHLEITDSEAGTRDENAQEASEGTDEVLGRDHIAVVVEEHIVARVAEWQEKTLPRLEEIRAWTVWKETRGSRTLRDMLTASAEVTIKKYCDRLDKLKSDFLDGEWSSDSAITEICASLDPTIDDLEKEKWKVSVWQRRKEPAHVVRNSKAAHRAAPTPQIGITPGLPFTVHQGDRMSVSPTPAMRVGAEDDGETFHTPEGSPDPTPDVDAEPDGFDASDEMSADLNEPADDDLSGSDSGTTDGFDDSRDTHDSLEQRDSEMAEIVITSSPPRAPSTPRSVTKFADRLREVLKPESGGSPRDASSSDELPPLKSFIPQRITHKPRPDKESFSGISTQPIDLTGLSSDSPVPSSSKSKKGVKLSPLAKKGQADDFSNQPDAATAAHVDCWDHSDLSRRRDRQRILIKMLYEYGSGLRDELHRLFSESRPKFRMDLEAAMRRLMVGSDTHSAIDDAARLAIAWFASNASIMAGTRTVPWDQLLESPEQIGQFLSMLAKYLKMRDSKLFIPSAPNAKSSARPDAPEVTHLSKSEAEDVSRDTPHKKRKKEVQASQAAIKFRRSAHQRQQAFRETLESQPAAASSQAMALNGSVASLSTVTINPKKGEQSAPIYIAKRIAKQMKGHQITGVRFMWNEITASEDADGPQGCLLAHTMGLGKTMQTIALLVALVEVSGSGESKIRNQLPAHLRPRSVRGEHPERQLRMLVLCPSGLIQNWAKELELWAPKKLRNVFVVEASTRTKQRQEIMDWHKVGGVLLIGYPMLRSFVTRGSKKEQEAADDQANKISDMLLDGSEVVVADEAHNLKNPKARISVVAGLFKTHTRIALTGTPMSNDVEEIYALVSWVAPDYLGEHTWFMSYFAEPIKEGTYNDSSPSEKRKSLMKLQVLHHEIAPKVDRADITALRGSLKSKTEFVITVDLTQTQETLYKRVIAGLLGGGRNKQASQVTIFSWLGVLMLLTNHPDAFRRKLLTPAPRKKKGGKKGALEDASADSDSAAAPVVALDTTEQVIAAQTLTQDPGDEDLFALGFTREMVDSIVEDYDEDTDPQLSAKMPIFLSILDLSFQCRDKVLVFSGSIPTINYVSALLRRQDIPFGRIDGQTAVGKRMDIIKDFNNDHFDVMIVSTRAGGVGLNIQAANRVVILDFSFNPTWEEQAIGRAYRLGQTKPVFVYRFVAGGTFESNIRNKQLFKTSLTQRVVDKKNPRRTAQRNTRDYLYDPKLVPQEDISRWLKKDPGVLDVIIQQQGQGKEMHIRSIQTTETLEEDAQDEPLDEEEKRQVQEEIQLGRQRGRMGAYSGLPPLSAATSTAMMAAAATMALNGRNVSLPAATQALATARAWQGSTQPNGPPIARAPAAPPSTAPAVHHKKSGQILTPEFRPLPPTLPRQ
ncbi:hypothetical protein LTR53_002840 [Teratosphaeriaceae sp. CCFEE 6253]|nr:hypothetical protein LTR53_002840 [Teratosphaeriaceae sp. CCFEE 6253]